MHPQPTRHGACQATSAARHGRLVRVLIWGYGRAAGRAPPALLPRLHLSSGVRTVRQSVIRLPAGLRLARKASCARRLRSSDRVCGRAGQAASNSPSHRRCLQARRHRCDREPEAWRPHRSLRLRSKTGPLVVPNSREMRSKTAEDRTIRGAAQRRFPHFLAPPFLAPPFEPGAHRTRSGKHMASPRLPASRRDSG